MIFVNRLLGIGIGNESINHALLVANGNVIGYGLDKKVKNLNNACSDTKIHRDSYTEESLDMLAMIHQAERQGKIAGLK